MIRENFGIVTACYKDDYFMVRALCESIRYFSDDVPICVIVDGDFSVSDLEELYGVIPLRVSEFKDRRLRTLCAGSPRSKLAAIWESPFETFLCVDSDVIFWGDVIMRLDLVQFRFQILSDLRSSDKNKDGIKHYFFNPDRINDVDPGYDWKNRLFFCAGAFAARLGCLDVDEYIRLEEFSALHPGVFSFAEQGILNYMVHKLQDEDSISVGEVDLQFIPVDYGIDMCNQRFGKPTRTPILEVKDPVLMHFCGVKPLIQNRGAFRWPFTTFRLLHYKRKFRKRKSVVISAWFQIFFDEIRVVGLRIKRRISS